MESVTNGLGKEQKECPFGLAYMATATKKAGHDVNVVDGSLDDLTVEETVNRALENDPHVVGITCTTPLYFINQKI